MHTEQEILNAFERGKGFGFAECMKIMEARLEVGRKREEAMLKTIEALLRKAQEK